MMDIQHLPRRPMSGKRKQLRRLSPARQQQIQPPEARSAGTEAARSLDLKYPKLRNNNCNLALQQPDPAESERNQDASDRRGGIARSRNTPASPRYLRLSADKSGKINTCSTTHRQAHGALTGKKKKKKKRGEHSRRLRPRGSIIRNMLSGTLCSRRSSWKNEDGA